MELVVVLLNYSTTIIWFYFPLFQLLLLLSSGDTYKRRFKQHNTIIIIHLSTWEGEKEAYKRDSLVIFVCPAEHLLDLLLFRWPHWVHHFVACVVSLLSNFSFNLSVLWQRYFDLFNHSSHSYPFRLQLLFLFWLADTLVWPLLVIGYHLSGYFWCTFHFRT